MTVLARSLYDVTDVAGERVWLAEAISRGVETNEIVRAAQLYLSRIDVLQTPPPKSLVDGEPR